MSERARRQKQLQPFDMCASGKLLALIVHPENAKGKRRVHRRLRFLGIDAEHRKRGLSRAQHGAGVNRAEGVLQVGTATEMLDLEAAIFAQQNALEHALILRPQQPLQGPSAAVAVSADLQQFGLCLSKPHYVSDVECGP